MPKSCGWRNPHRESNSLFAAKLGQAAQIMFGVIPIVLRTLRAVFQSRRQLLQENLALRRRLLALSRAARKRKFRNSDQLLWICLRASG
jgi:hypothetical protein